MLIDVAITKEIINESLPIHYRHASFKQRYQPYFTPILLLVYGTIYTILNFNRESSGWDWLIMPVMFLIMAGLFFVWINHRRNNAGKHMIKALTDKTHYEIEVTEDGLITRLSDATYNQKWTVYPKAIISKDLVLLYQLNNSFAMFHYSFFSNEDFNLFKQLVRNRVHQVKED